MNNMEKAIYDIIEKRYKRKFVGDIKVTKLGKGWAGYKAVLYREHSTIPLISISADLEAEDFLKYVEQELISRQLHKVQSFTGVKYELEDEVRRTC